MALSYGFYDSVNHDRRYNATQISQMFDGIISDGVYANYAKCMIVKASSVDNQVIVQPGRAWFNHTWTYNDADLPVDAPVSALILDRIDALCIDINSDGTVRENSLQWVQGVEASEPVKPTEFANTETHHQYPLCFVTRHADVATIAQEDIENAVGTELCPFVTGLMETINTSELLLQWSAQFSTWTREQRTAFTRWFENLQYVLDGDVAGHLQNEIDSVKDAANYICYFEQAATDGSASRDYPVVGSFIYSLADQAMVTTIAVIHSGDDFEYGNNIVDVEGTALSDVVNNSMSRFRDVIQSLTANNTRIYMDYHDGKYGYNTSASRGADTFHPFTDMTDIYNAVKAKGVTPASYSPEDIVTAINAIVTDVKHQIYVRWWYRGTNDSGTTFGHESFVDGRKVDSNDWNTDSDSSFWA